MALTIKNLKCGTVAVYPSSGDVVDTVATGKSVLVDNISFVNTSGSTVSLNVQFQNGSAAIPVAENKQAKSSRHRLTFRIEVFVHNMFFLS